MKRLTLAVASLAGAGYVPAASGTFAALLTLPLAWWLLPHPIPYAAVTAGVCILGVWSAGAAERILGEKDSHKIVIDEAAGMLIAAAALPPDPLWLGAAFVLFRIFDVWKPFPIRGSQALPGGWGVVVDDVLAGAYANLLLHGFRWLHPGA